MAESPTHNLVHFNLAVAREALDHPVMDGFVRQVSTVNRIAEESPGFVWMAAGDTTEAIRVFGEPRALMNMTVWRSIDALRAFTYEGLHKAALKRKAEWFLPSDGPAYVLWWISAAERPTFDEARRRLELLATHGPTAAAFTFHEPFDPQGTRAGH